jgi:dipeptidase E
MIQTMQLLALSSSRVGGGAYLAAALPMIERFLGRASLRLAFVPFANADGNDEAYAEKVREALAPLPYAIQMVTAANGKDLLQQCDAIMVGGGNTFKLLHDIYRHDLFFLIRQRVESGMPYIGWSAGANLTGKTICTTNDMPIIQPQSFAAFAFLPFQINPHYYNVTIEGFHGETRDQRLAEFLLLHPSDGIVGLPEGTALQLQNGKLQLLGGANAVLFTTEEMKQQPKKQTLSPNTDLSFLL